MSAKLYYFDFSGLGEPCRFMLAYGKEKFDDVRMSREEFGEKKPSLPFGKVPYLEIDGMKMHQSMTICRYLARKHGIAGKTTEDVINADIMAETVSDVRGGLARYYWESDAATKERVKESTLTQANDYLDKLEKVVAKNGGHFVKGQLTYADVFFGSLASYFCHMAGSDLFASRPALKALKEKVLEQPGIKAYLASRPKMAF